MENDFSQFTQEEKDVLWLPFCVNCNEDYIDALCHRLGNYKKLLKDRHIKVDDSVVNTLCHCLPEILKEYVNGNVLNACKHFSMLMNRTLLKEVKDNPNLWIKNINTSENKLFYRSRVGTYTSADELKHIPFDKLYLTKSDRFSSQGSASLYLSYSKETCNREINAQKSTTAIFVLKDDVEVFDMSAFELNKSNIFNLANENYVRSLNSLWPLIAACNSIAYCCPVCNNEECRSITRNFKIEYVIPQMLASYIKKVFMNEKIRGIRYYTVRNENLDSSKETWMDLVLFTEYNSERKYDEFLDEAFDVSIMH